MKRHFFTVLALAFLFAAHAAAGLPQLLTYQGVLTDGSGSAVSDGVYSITFRLYDVDTGGSPIWDETNPSVQVTKGIFNATLGTIFSLADLAFDTPYYVGISVAGGDELTPRQILTAVPYSFNAKAVMGTANEFPSSGSVGIGTTLPSYPFHVMSSNIRPARIEGTAAGAWALLSINASGTGSNPGIELCRNGSDWAEMYVAGDHDFKLRQSGSITLTMEDVTGNLGLGTESPLEKLHVAGGLALGNTANTNAGTLRWTGADFEGYDGSTWKSLTATGGGSLPAGALGQTLRHNGSSWAATSSLYNNGTQIGIGTTSPGARLDILGTSTQDIKIETSSIIGKADVVLKSTGGTTDYLLLEKQAPSALGTTAGVALANLSRVTAGTLAGPLMLQVVSANPMYFVTNNLERMRLDANGNLGINTTSPGAKLHVDGNQWDLTNTEGDFKIGDAAYRLKFGVATAGGGAGTANIRVAGGAQKLVLGGGSSEVLSIDAAGNTNIGGASSNAKLRLYRSGVDSAMVLAHTNTYGGRIEFRDDTNSETLALEPDIDGTGGFLRLRRGSNQTGFFIDGNYNGSNEPHVVVQGSIRSARFYMDELDNASVQLPASSIGSGEILDEPGAASYTDAGDPGISLPPGEFTTIGSRSIFVPAAGYVLVIATTEAEASHTSGSPSLCRFGVSDEAGILPDHQQVDFSLSNGPATGHYHIPATVHGLFSIAGSGTHTYYLIGQAVYGEYSCYDTQLTLLYIPTAYGTVNSTLARAGENTEETGTRPGLTAADVAAERTQSIADNNERIERELAEMRARIEELEREARNE